MRARSLEPRPRHARARAEGRHARRGADAPARAEQRGAALRQALPRRAQARRHRAQRGAASLQGHLAARRADPPHGRHARSPAQGHRGASCAGSCTRSSAAATARAGSSAGRCSRPSWSTSSRRCPGVEGVDALEIRDEQRNVGDRAPPARRRRAAVPRPRPHRGEGPRRHQVHGRPKHSTARSSASPTSSGGRSTKARIVLEDAGLQAVVTLYRESYEDRDTVLEQRPARGQMVYEGTEVTIWVARRGYLEHLPAIYRRSDAVGRNLVRDLCFVFEHMFDSIEQNLTDGWRFYDPHVAPLEFLDWLVGVDGVHARPRLARGAEARARSSAPSISIASAAPSAASRCSSSCSPATSRTSTRTRGRSKASASRARAPRRARASRSTRWCCRRSIWRTASS